MWLFDSSSMLLKWTNDVFEKKFSVINYVASHYTGRAFAMNWPIVIFFSNVHYIWATKYLSSMPRESAKRISRIVRHLISFMPNLFEDGHFQDIFFNIALPANMSKWGTFQKSLPSGKSSHSTPKCWKECIYCIT